MRPLEVLLLAANVPTLLRPLLPRWRPGRWLDFVPALGLLLIPLQVLLEGYRWQMVPAYALTGALFLLTLRRAVRPRPADGLGARRRRVWSTLGSALGLLLLILAAVPPLLVPVPRLPAPTGPVAVGTVTYHLVDPSREEVFTDDPADRREIMVQLWYPAQPREGAQRAPYLPHVDVAGPAIAAVRDLPPFLLDHLALVRSHALLDVDVLAGEPGYPLLIFSHGLSGYRTQNALQMEELASHGYVVAAIDHTYACAVTVFPDGRVALYDDAVLPDDAEEGAFVQAANRLVSVWAADVRFVLDQLERFDAGELDSPFAGRLDLERVGVFGHSTGGGTAVQVCWLDARCRAGLGMDAWVVPVSDAALDDGLAQPFMFMRSETWGSEENTERLLRLAQGLQQGGVLLTIAGTTHYDFAELPMLSPLASVLGFKGPLNGRRALRIVEDYTLAFFEQHLRGVDSPLLEGPSPAHPEVGLQVRQP